MKDFRVQLACSSALAVFALLAWLGPRSAGHFTPIEQGHGTLWQSDGAATFTYSFSRFVLANGGLVATVRRVRASDVALNGAATRSGYTYFGQRASGGQNVYEAIVAVGDAGSRFGKQVISVRLRAPVLAAPSLPAFA